MNGHQVSFGYMLISLCSIKDTVVLKHVLLPPTPDQDSKENKKENEDVMATSY